MNIYPIEKHSRHQLNPSIHFAQLYKMDAREVNLLILRFILYRIGMLHQVQSTTTIIASKRRVLLRDSGHKLTAMFRILLGMTNLTLQSEIHSTITTNSKYTNLTFLVK